MKPKHQRLTLGLCGLGAIAAAGLLAASGLSDKAAFFFTPSAARDNPPVAGKAVRLGGMVAENSVKKAADGVTIAFVVTDGQANTPVTFRGILPDLFREKSGVIAEGSFRPDGHFVASNLLAKHDERYVPPELAKSMPKSAPDTQ